MNTNATAPAAAKAPQAQAPAWMDMAEDEFNLYLKKAKIGGKRATEMRARRNGETVIRTDFVAGKGFVQVEEQPAIQEEPAATPVGDAQPKEEAPAPVKTTTTTKAPAAPKTDKAATSAGALRTRYIDPRMVDVREGWNARVDFGDLAELKEQISVQKSIDGHGLVNDIRVKEKADGRYELIDGERRLTCILGLIDEGEIFEFGIPAKVEPADSTDANLIIKMFVANAGKPFLPYEEALYYKRLRDAGWTIKQIEKETGRSDNSIVGALALLDADDDLTEAIIKGEVGATLGKSIAVNVRGDKTKQKALVAKAKEAKKSGDKKAMKQVHKEIDDSRRAKAAKKAPNLKLKARKADESEIADLGAKVGAMLKELMEQQGMPFDGDLLAWVKAERDLQLAATFGALQALKRVMGVKVDVEFS